MSQSMRGTCLLAILLSLMTGCSGARPTGFFPISYWCPPPAEEARYREAAECGFNLAFNGNLELADQVGMKCLVADPRVAAAVAKPGPETDAGLDEAVKQHAKHRAFWGFYLKDEPNANRFADLGHVNRHLLARAPDCVPFVNLFPTYANAQQLGTKTYTEHVERFMTEVKPKVLSYDHYALMESGKERADYFQNMEIIRAAGLKHDTPTWFIFLITPHFDYRDPDEGDLRWQIYTALAYGYRGLAYFTYWSVNDQRFGESIIGRDGKPTHRYALARKLNAEVNAIGPVLARLRSTAVYHTSARRPAGTRGPGPDSIVQNAEGAGLIVGELQDPKGRSYLFLTNASPHRTATTRVTFADGVRIREELPRSTTQPIRIPVQGRPPQMVINLAAGDGRLFEVEVPAR